MKTAREILETWQSYRGGIGGEMQHLTIHAMKEYAKQWIDRAAEECHSGTDEEAILRLKKEIDAQ